MNAVKLTAGLRMLFGDDDGEGPKHRKPSRHYEDLDTILCRYLRGNEQWIGNHEHFVW